VQDVGWPRADLLALVAAAVLLLVFFLRHGTGNHLFPALGITIAFALVGRLARGVDTSGALAGGVIALILAAEDLRLFWILLAVFLITLAATKLGGSRKKQLRVAEADRGRSAAQVMSNLYVGTLMLARPFQMTTELAVLLLLAALAEVAADTVSSEIGTAYPGKTVLITTWKSVPAGENGGISVAGTLAGILAAVLVAACALALGLVSFSGAAVAACAATLGMLVDSALGAALERKGLLGNNSVNLLGTMAAVGIAWSLLYLVFSR
jgi:uncharacterized protein (TIGR00297 family)